MGRKRKAIDIAEIQANITDKIHYHERCIMKLKDQEQALSAKHKKMEMDQLTQAMQANNISVEQLLSKINEM